METDQKLKRGIWLDYISKLNDRALNRQRASGTTTWAVAGVIAILVVKGLSDLTNITASKSAAHLYLTTTTTVVDTVFFAGTLLMLLLSMGAGSAEVRLKSRLDRATTPVLVVVLCLSFAMFGAANVVTASVAPDSLYNWPFWTLGAFFLTYAVSYPASRVCVWVKHRKHFHDLPELSSPVLTRSRRHRAAFYGTGTLLLSLGLSISLIPTVQVLPRITTPMHVNALTWALYAAGVIFLSLFVCFRLAARPYDHFLTQLERRIVVEDLDADVIRSVFIKEFIGEDIREWLEKAEQELKRLHADFDKTASDAEAKFADLAKLDRSMQFEIDGRRKAICEAVTKAFSAYIDHAEKLQQQIDHLSDQRAPVSCPDLFKQILDDWKRQLATIKPRQEAVCAACRKATGEQTKAEQCASPLQEPAHAGS